MPNEFHNFDKFKLTLISYDTGKINRMKKL